MNLKSLFKLDKTIFTPFVLQLLVIMFVVEFVKGALLVSVLPVYMKTSLGLTAFAIGWALALQYIGDNLFRTPIGWIVDRIGYRFSVLFGVIITLISITIMTYFGYTLWILIASALLGIGTSPLWPSVITGVTAVAGEKSRATIMSVVYTAWLTGTGLGPVLINFIIKGNYFRPAFLLLIGMMVLVLAVSLFLPKRQTENKEKKAVAATASHEQNNIWERFVAYLGKVNRTIHVSWAFYPALFAQTFALGLLAPVITLYAQEILHLSKTMYSVFLIFGGGITVGMLYPMGKLVDKWGTKWFLHIGFAMAGLAIMLFAMTTYLPYVIIVVAFIGLSYALIIPAWNALIAAVVPEEKRGAVWGFFLTIEGSGMVVGSIVSGKLWDDIAPAAPFIVSGCVVLVLFVLHLFISKPQKVMVR